MALLEELYRVIIKLGLVPKIIKNLPLLSIILTIIGVAWIAILPNDGNFRQTYISENALMPSQAYSYFRETEWNILRGYRTQIMNFENDNNNNYNNNSDGIYSNLKTMENWFLDIGFKTNIYHSEFGNTLYAVYHAPKSDDTEAILLGAAYFNSDNEFNIGGLSLAISLARYFHRWSIWSKNIIIVIPETPNLALRSWVNAYHTDLDLTAGSIESAIMLDYASVEDNFKYIELYYEGLNGQLPNLDLINVAVSISEHEGPRISLHQTIESELYINNYWSRLRILINSIKELSLAGIKNGHGNEAFSGWRIQAITLKAKSFGEGYDITTFGRVPEAIFRAINNLLEKFHQSFFFYLLLGPRLFISIGTYLPSAGLIVAAFIISSLDKILNSGFEINHLLKYGINSFLIFGIILLISLILSQLLPILSIQLNYYILILSSIILSISSIFIKIPIKSEIKILLRSLSLLYISIILSSLLVLNFALTFTIALFAFPLTFINESLEFHQSIINSILLIISNPFILSLIFSSNFDNGQIQEFYNGLITSWKYLGSHTWFIIILGWVSVWLTIAITTFGEDSSRNKASEFKIK
ncbi:hypothetical protein WICMUC_003476 [Wickerhamomyces mucosus]|uniref:GPI transamidase component GAA1 n=1 Tax=Wickerhamomyces mucosus TaxID=1378264 RepID=A0A9P8PN27_9ASCO|nr:hypothetical protein WICMUC_003476 [Wickerhamomyces mucosus]